MTYSWNWVEKHKRRQRRRKWLSMLSSIVTIGLLLYFFSGKPFFNSLPTASDQPMAGRETDSIDEVLPPTNSSKSSSAFPPSPEKEQYEVASPSQELPRVRPAKNTSTDQQRMAAAQQVLVKLRERIDSESVRLNKNGGNVSLQIPIATRSCIGGRLPNKGEFACRPS